MINENENIAPIEKLTKYFANETTKEENLWVEKWRDSSQENLKEFNAIKKLWNITDIPSGLNPIDIDSEWEKIDSAIIPAKTIKFKPVRFIAIAASIALIAVLTVIGISRFNTTINQTEMAQVKKVTLPDGSIINLNAKSKISFKDGFGTRHRNIKLSGEAYFNVSSNKDIPFIISANGASIEVVGTQFNVKAYKGQKEIKVTVAKGIVKLTNPKSPKKEIFINAGETGKFHKENKVIEKVKEIDGNDIAWKTRIINFADTPLHEVAEILSNTYHLDIHVDKNIQSCTITVNFINKDISEILQIIKSTFNLQIKQIDDKIIISGPGCTPL